MENRLNKTVDKADFSELKAKVSQKIVLKEFKKQKIENI